MPRSYPPIVLIAAASLGLGARLVYLQVNRGAYSPSDRKEGNRGILSLSALTQQRNDYATAKNCYDALVERYKLFLYSKEEGLDIASTRFGMVTNAFSAAHPLAFAQDVSAETTVKTKDNSALYRGNGTLPWLCGRCPCPHF